SSGGGSTACSRPACPSTSPRRSRTWPSPPVPRSPVRCCGSAARARSGPEMAAHEPAPASDTDVELLRTSPAMAPLIARAAVTAVGRPGVRGELPGRRVMLTGVQQDVERLAAYARVCGFTLRDRVPPTWLHVLTFPLQV